MYFFGRVDPKQLRMAEILDGHCRAALAKCCPGRPPAIIWQTLAVCLLISGFATDHTRAEGRLVEYKGSTPPGTVLIRTAERRLYLVLGEGQAIQYKVGVGRASRQWIGKSSITGKYLAPNWEPPDDVRRDKPGLPQMIPGGAPNNPMGVAAMTLSGGQYAIHGTNKPDSVGGFVSYGCIRMYNQDIADLYRRVQVGTPVLVVR